MRTREEIEKDEPHCMCYETAYIQHIILEVLLDIREFIEDISSYVDYLEKK